MEITPVPGINRATNEERPLSITCATNLCAVHSSILMHGLDPYETNSRWASVIVSTAMMCLSRGMHILALSYTNMNNVPHVAHEQHVCDLKSREQADCIETLRRHRCGSKTQPVVKIAIPMCSTYVAVRMRYFLSRREPQLALASCWTYKLYNDQQDY